MCQLRYKHNAGYIHSIHLTKSGTVFLLILDFCSKIPWF